jgi:hypothetical protein
MLRSSFRAGTMTLTDGRSPCPEFTVGSARGVRNRTNTRRRSAIQGREAKSMYEGKFMDVDST